MQLTAKNEMTSKEDQFQLSLLAAMGNTQRKEAADPLASKLNKVADKYSFPFRRYRIISVADFYIISFEEKKHFSVVSVNYCSTGVRSR